MSSSTRKAVFVTGAMEGGRRYEVLILNLRPSSTKFCLGRARGSLQRIFPKREARCGRSPKFSRADQSLGSVSLHFKSSVFLKVITRRGQVIQHACEAFVMAAIGSLVFCTDCGNLLEANTGRKAYIHCDVCGTQNKGETYEVIVPIAC